MSRAEARTGSPPSDQSEFARQYYFAKLDVDAVVVPPLIEEETVVASDRGALAELVEDLSVKLSIPRRFTPTSGKDPTLEELRPWLDAILAIWDDERLSREIGAALSDVGLPASAPARF